nr:unnamed protein product [Callosobruchus analis]
MKYEVLLLQMVVKKYKIALYVAGSILYKLVQNFFNGVKNNIPQIMLKLSAKEVSTIHSARNDISSVFLATAHVEVYDKDKNKHTLRALLDNGAESSFITEEACNRLQIQREKANLFHVFLPKCEVQIHSASSGFSINIMCFVLPKITGTLPKYKMDISRLNIPNGLQLADAWFAEPQNINI